MRIFWLMVLSLMIVGPAAAAVSAKDQPSEKSVERHQKAYLKKCGTGMVKDCARMPELKGLAGDPARTRTAIDMCTAYNASQTTFCGLVGRYPPSSPEIMNAVRDVIDAKKSLLKALASPTTARP